MNHQIHFVPSGTPLAVAQTDALHAGLILQVSRFGQQIMADIALPGCEIIRTSYKTQPNERAS